MSFSHQRKIVSSAKLPNLLKKLRAQSKKIVFTNGCFDILHAGHVLYLHEAKKLGDILILGLNSDASVKRLKGPTRPLIDLKNRAAMLAGLEDIDYIVSFNEDTPEKLIKIIKPNILVKGGDWNVKNMAGGTFVESYGGKVKSLSFIDGFSTTNLIAKIKAIP